MEDTHARACIAVAISRKWLRISITACNISNRPGPPRQIFKPEAKTANGRWLPKK